MFARDNSIYTLSTFPRLPTYLIRWEPTNPQAPKNWKASITKETHHKPSTGFRASRQGVIAVLASDGHVSMHDALTLKETTSKR